MTNTLERSVLAHQFLRVDQELRDFVFPAVVRELDDGLGVVVVFQEQSFVLRRGDWVVEISPGLFERLTDDDMTKRYKKYRT